MASSRKAYDRAAPQTCLKMSRKAKTFHATSRPEPRAASPEPAAGGPDADRKAALKAQALADSGVQAMLEVFPAEIRDVEEM